MSGMKKNCAVLLLTIEQFTLPSNLLKLLGSGGVVFDEKYNSFIEHKLHIPCTDGFNSGDTVGLWAVVPGYVFTRIAHAG